MSTRTADVTADPRTSITADPRTSITADPRTSITAVLTPEQLWRELFSLKELLIARIDAIEKAIIVAHDDMVRVPTEVQKQIGHLKELHDLKITAMAERFGAALESMDKATVAAFAASEKAIAKSEDAQRELNIKNNEFRGQLKDQSDILMPRTESLSNMKNVNDRVDDVKTETESKFELLRKEIQVLREFRSEGGGKSAGFQQFWGIVLGTATLIATLLGIASVGLMLLRR